MFLLDTKVIVHALNGRAPAMEARPQQELAVGQRLLVSPVVISELKYDIAKSAWKEASGSALDLLVSEGFEIVPFDDDAREVGDIRAYLGVR